ncbi:MAG: TolC family protein [Thermoanaerobaculia bacterium]
MPDLRALLVALSLVFMATVLSARQNDADENSAPRDDCSGDAATTAAGTGPLTFSEALARARAGNLGLRAEEARRPVAMAAVAQANERLNPEIQWEAARDAPRQTVTLTLPIEAGGKRARRIAVAEADLRTTAAELSLSDVHLEIDVRRAYFSLAAAQAKAAATDAVVAISRRAAAAASDRYKAGDVARLELLQAQLEADRAAAARCTVDAEVASAAARLWDLLAGTDTGIPTAVDDPLSGPEVDGEESATIAKRESRELQVADLELAAGESRVSLARASRTPDVAIFAGPTFDQPEYATGWKAGAAFTIPVFASGRANLESATATLAQLRAEREAIAGHIGASVTAAAARMNAARREADTLRTSVLPRSLEVQNLAEEAYRAGETDLAAMLQALGASREIQLQAIAAALAYQEARADLELAMGAPLP